MTIDEIIRLAAEAEYSTLTETIDAFCSGKQISFPAFSEQFARHVATKYQQKSMSWLDADAAMEHTWLSDFAFQVFLAFDTAEYHPQTPHLTPDEISRPLIDALLPNPYVGSQA